jgi:opacity protein-like surface antigen
MSRVGAIVGGLLGALAIATGAQAADPPWRPVPLPPEDATPAPVPQELASGWYLRADVGYRAYQGGSSIASTDANYSNNINGTIGFGWKYRWFRADLTYDRGAPTRAGISTTNTALVQPQYTAKIRPEAVLVNAYFDLGSWAGFTPYIGGGVGVSRLASSGYYDTNPLAVTTVNPLPGSGQTQNLAWAAMAGVAVQISPRWMIDAGVRYMSLGQAAGNNISPAIGTVAVAPFFRNITAEEARIGLRFLLD